MLVIDSALELAGNQRIGALSDPCHRRKKSCAACHARADLGGKLLDDALADELMRLGGAFARG